MLGVISATAGFGTSAAPGVSSDLGSLCPSLASLGAWQCLGKALPESACT